MLVSGKPLFYDESTLVFAKKNKIYLRQEDGSEVLLMALPVSLLKQMLMSIRILARLFRLDIYSSAIHGENYYFCFDKKLFSFDKNLKKLSLEMSFNLGHGPLSFCSINSLEGFDGNVYFGDYFGNPNCHPVSIYRRVELGNWEKCYTFSDGLINHIHGLIEDSSNNCIWILTGDFGDSFGIYKASYDFSEVEQVLVGDQIYRSCVAYPFAGGLLYATDTHLEENSIRMLKNTDHNWVSEEITKLNGPVIYGTELQDFYIFATCVEPGLRKSNKFLNLLAYDLAPGIIKNQVEIVAISKLDLKKIILEVNPKDFLPARLFQFGSACFPGNAFRSNNLLAYYTATKNYEGQMRSLDLKALF